MPWCNKKLKQIAERKSEENRLAGGVQCPYCLLYWKSLGCHLYAKHSIFADEYREEKGYYKWHQLTCPETHQKAVELGKRYCHVAGFGFQKGHSCLGKKLDIRQEYKDERSKLLTKAWKNDSDRKEIYSKRMINKFEKNPELEKKLRAGHKKWVENYPHIKKICPICKQGFSVFPGAIKRGWGNTCSQKCSAKYKAQLYYIGKKSITR